MDTRFGWSATLVGLLACGTSHQPNHPEAFRLSEPKTQNNEQNTAVERAQQSEHENSESATATCTGKPSPDLTRTLSLQAAKAKECYDKLLRSDPTARGRVRLAVRLGPDGKVLNGGPLVISDGLGDKETSECIIGKFREGVTNHPPVGGCINAEIPLNFQPKIQWPEMCQNLDAHACEEVALRYWTDPNRSVAVGRNLLSWACSENNANACLGLGYSLRHEQPKDIEQARRVYSQLCDGRFAAGCTNVGRIDEELGRVSQAVANYELGCKMDDPLGCVEEARCFRHGRGVEKDGLKAFSLNQRACEMGAPAGCNNLGDMHEEGDAVAKNLAIADQLYSQVCAKPWSVSTAKCCGNAGSEERNRSHAFGCYSLANLRQDLAGGMATEETRSLFKVACETGVKDACEYAAGAP